jgi:hypothetical protein
MSNPEKKLKDRTLTEIVIGLSEMHDHMSYIVAHSTKGHYENVALYVGANYDKHITELRNRGHDSIANRYEERARGWRT